MTPSESHNASMPRLIRTPISYRSSKTRASNTLQCACNRHREMETCPLERASDLLHVNSDQSADNKTNMHRCVRSNNYHDVSLNNNMHDFFSNDNHYANKVERSASQPSKEVQNSAWTKYNKKETHNDDDDYLIQVDEVKCNEETQWKNANNTMSNVCDNIEMKLTSTDEECTLQRPPADVVSMERERSELSSKVINTGNTSHENFIVNHIKCNHSCYWDNVMYNTNSHNSRTTSKNFSKHASSDKIITENKSKSWRDETCDVCHNNSIVALQESKNMELNNCENVYTSHQNSCNTENSKSSNYDENKLINDTKCKEVMESDIGKIKSKFMHVKPEAEWQSEKCERIEKLKQEQKLEQKEQREKECVEVELELEMERAEQIAEAKLLEDINELWCEMYYDDKKRKHHHQHEKQQQRYRGNITAASNVASNEHQYKLLPVTKLPSIMHANDKNGLITKGSININYKEHFNESEKVECVKNTETITHNVYDECHYNDSNANNYYKSALKVKKVNKFDNIDKSEIFTEPSPSQGEFNVELQREEYYQRSENEIECDDKELSVFDTLTTETTSRKQDNAALFSISKTQHNSSSCEISNTINTDERDDNEVINLPATVAVTSLCIATTEKSTDTEITSEPMTLVEQKECQEDLTVNEIKDSNDHYSNVNNGGKENADNFENLWYVCHDSQTNLEELKNENMKSETETCYQEQLLQEELQTKGNEYINNDLLTCNRCTEEISSLIVEGDALEKQEQMITKCTVSRDMASNESINLCTNALNDINNSINITREEQSSTSAETSNANEENQINENTNTNCCVDNEMSNKYELTKTCHEEQIVSETTNTNDNDDRVEQSQEESVCKTKIVTPNNIHNDEVDTKESDYTHLDDKNINAVICEDKEMEHETSCEDNKLEEKEEEELQMHKNSQLYKLFYPYFYWCYHDNEGDDNNTFTLQNKCHYDRNVFCGNNICGCESTLLSEYSQENNAHCTSCQETLRCVNSKCKVNHHQHYDDCCFYGRSLCHGKQHTHLTRHVLIPPLDLSCLYIPNNEVLMEMYNNVTSSKLLEASSPSPSLSLLPTLVEVEEKEADSNNEGDIISNNIINNSCMTHSYRKNVTSDKECIDKNDTNNNSSNTSENASINKSMTNEKSNAASAGHHSKTVITTNSNAIKTHSVTWENAFTSEHDAKCTNNSNSCSLTQGKKVVFRDESDALDDMHRNATRINECHQLFRIQFILLCSHEQRVRRQIAQDWEHEFNRISQCAHTLKEQWKEDV